MAEAADPIRVLLVDDEEEFRRSASRSLGNRGLAVREAEDGTAALAAVRQERPDLVILDLRMPGMDGIETLRRLRGIDESLPVIVLTGHGSLHDALAGIALEITDFLQKPVDLDALAVRVREMVARGGQKGPLRERLIRDLMRRPESYPAVRLDQPVREVLSVLCDAFLNTVERTGPGVRSARVYDPEGGFVGMVRFSDLLKLVLPGYLRESPYASYFTGMFLAQCKVVGQRRLEDILGPDIRVEVDEALMEAVHLMVVHRLITLPVMEDERLVGVLTERDVILEIARAMGWEAKPPTG